MSTGDLGSWFRERPKWVQEAAKRLLENEVTYEPPVLSFFSDLI